MMNSQTSASGGTGFTVTTTTTLINSGRLLYTILTLLQIMAFTTSSSDGDQMYHKNLEKNVNFYRLEKNISFDDSSRIEFSYVRNSSGVDDVNKSVAEKVNVFSRKDGDKSNRINVIGEWGDNGRSDLRDRGIRVLKESSDREEIEKRNYYRGNSSYYRHLEVENDGREFRSRIEKQNNYIGDDLDIFKNIGYGNSEGNSSHHEKDFKSNYDVNAESRELVSISNEYISDINDRNKANFKNNNGKKLVESFEEQEKYDMKKIENEFKRTSYSNNLIASEQKFFHKRSLKSFSEESTNNLTETGKQLDNFITFPRSNTSFTSHKDSRSKPSELPIIDDGLTLEVDPPVYEGYHLNNTNCTNDYCASDEDYFDMIRQYMLPTPYEWVLVALNAAVFVVGLVGNALVCVAVYRNHSMRTVTNYFIVNLAVADFMVILFCLPPTVLWDVTETWFMGTALCKIVLYVQTVSIAVSVLTLTFISVDRWYAICFPLKFKSTTGRAKTAIIIIWMLALTFDIPELVVLTTEKRVPHLDMVYFTQCKATWSPESDRMWATAKMVVLYALPLAFMSFAYYQIARVLWKSDNIPGHTENSVMIQHNCRVSSNTSRRSAMNNTSTEGQLRSRRKAAKMLVAIVVMFAVCYFPVYLIWLLKLIVKIPNTDGYRVLSMLSHWLCYANSAMNPIIYNFMSGKFRQEFRRDFSQCICNKRAKNYDTFRLRSLPTRATKCNNDYRTNGATENTKFCAYRDVSTKRHRSAAVAANVNNGGGAVVRQATTQTTSSGGGLNPRVANHAQSYVSEDTNQGSFKMAVRTEHV